MNQHLRLKSFLYILMRDQLPTGKVEAVMEHLRALRPLYGSASNPAAFIPKEVVFSAKHLEAYADELADEILLKKYSDDAGSDTSEQ